MTSESYIVQQTDYYPYGLIAKNWTRVGEKATKDLFQGKTYEDLTKWYDFHARQYDAALGRWFGVDPQNQFHSPYLAMGNNPVMMVDPDGELAWFIPIIAGAIINTALNAKNINNVWDALGYAAVGAAAGAIGGGVGMHVGAGLKTGGFLAGAISGASDGASGGFASGFGNTAVGGGSLTQSLKAGALGAGIGGLSGGLLGGLTSGIASGLNDRSFWNGSLDLSSRTTACVSCLIEPLPIQDLSGVTVFEKFNPVAAGVYRAGASFWSHPVTYATVFATTSVIGGGIASSLLRTASRGAQAANVASKGVVNTVPRTKDVLGHIFRNAPGHVNPATAASQGRYISLFEKVAANPKNFNPNILNPQAAKNGVQAFTQTFRNGRQVWVHTRNGRIFDAGVNLIPK